MPAGSPRQQLVALAHFEGGEIVDVTHQAVFSTSKDDAYSVSPAGLAAFHSTAEATVLVRYLEQVRSVQLTYVSDDPAYKFNGPAATNLVDEQVFAKQKTLQLNPAPLATDAVFLRRVYLDLIGTLPTADEARAFLCSCIRTQNARS